MVLDAVPKFGILLGLGIGLGVIATAAAAI
jgi:hypothetical protein